MNKKVGLTAFLGVVLLLFAAQSIAGGFIELVRFDSVTPKSIFQVNGPISLVIRNENSAPCRVLHKTDYGTVTGTNPVGLAKVAPGNEVRLIGVDATGWITITFEDSPPNTNPCWVAIAVE